MSEVARDRLIHRIKRLNAIGTALSAERDHDHLLEHILLGAKELTNADGGSLYILCDDTLHFMLVHTTSLNLHMGGSSGKPIGFPPIALHDENSAPRRHMVVTRAALENSIINIPDAYSDTEFDLSGTRAFDSNTGYRSQSLLAVPMQDHEGHIIGVLQLINATGDDGSTIPFTHEDESLVASLASQAAVTLNRQHLIDGLQTLLQSLTRLIANAIDDKSPHTAGHCRRVPEITMALAQAINQDDSPEFKGTTFSEQALEELEMAAWLHDCGKITTPEYVIEKHTKLEAIIDRIQLVDARLELMELEAEVLAGADSALPESSGSYSRLPTREELVEIRDFLHRCNTGGEFLPEEDQQRLREIASLTTLPHGDNPARPLLTEEELAHLSIPKGTLSDEERQQINNHAAVTMRMLNAVPFPDHLSQVPLIACSHHERMDGKGYPKGIPAGDLPLQARILAIADIFEALTASDRGYREPMPLSKTLTILAYMCNEGHIDPQLYRLFLKHEVYADYAQKFLKPEQIDDVDATAISSILKQ